MPRGVAPRRRRLFAPVALLAAACVAVGMLAVVWLRGTESDYLRGVDRHDPLWTAVEAAQAYAADTGTMPVSTGALLDWLDGAQARFAAGGDVELMERRHMVGTSRIGTTVDGLWCVAVHQKRPAVLRALAGVPEQMVSVAAADEDEPWHTHDAAPDACAPPQLREK